MVLQGAKEISCSEESLKDNFDLFQIDDIIATGMRNRSVGGTNANAQSSRSHSIVTFNIKYQSDNRKVISCKLNVIDLAGSERAGVTNA